MSPEQVNRAVSSMNESIDAHGMYEKVCPCGGIAGGFLAEFKDMCLPLSRYICCPECGRANETGEFTVRFVPAVSRN